MAGASWIRTATATRTASSGQGMYVLALDASQCPRMEGAASTNGLELVMSARQLGSCRLAGYSDLKENEGIDSHNRNF